MTEASGFDHPSSVGLVVPGRNAARTLDQCLAAAVDLLEAGQLHQIIYVDDGSTDRSLEIAERPGVRALVAGGLGPGGARNLGWRAADSELIWFVDADCVVGSETLPRLRRAMEESRVAGVGGSYTNAVRQSLLARLIHAEIRERHLAVGTEVDYLGSFNVLYRRSALEQVDGFDESWVNGPGAPGAEDADLSYRLAAAGAVLRLQPEAQVAHHHPVSLWSYLRAQRLHGFWGVRLYRRHPRRSGQNSYSSVLDHLQPLLALVVIGALPFAWPGILSRRPAWILGLALGLLALSTVPMTVRLARRRGWEMVLFSPLALLRSFIRGVGLAWGVLDMVTPGQWRPRR